MSQSQCDQVELSYSVDGQFVQGGIFLEARLNLVSGPTMINSQIELCPKCQSNAHVRNKKVMIGAASPKKIFGGEEKAGYRRKDQLAVDECNSEVLKSPPLQQFVDGMYCDMCGIGFVSQTFLADDKP